MNEIPQSIWRKPWRSPKQALTWFALLTGAIFLIITCISFLQGESGRNMDSLLSAFVAALVIAAIAFVGLWFLRWVCCWRNFRRFLFGVACLVTLVALAYATENLRGKYAWQKHRQQCEAKGEKFAIADLMPPKVPDEKNFALAPLLAPMLDFTQGSNGVVWRNTNGIARLEKLSATLSPGRETNDQLVLGRLEKGTFADLGAWSEFYRGNTNYPQASAPTNYAEPILVALGKFDVELQQLQEAASMRPYSWFPIQYGYEPSWGILLPHLARMKGLAMLTQVRATAELEAGLSAKAFEDLKLGLRMSDSIREEPLLIDHLVRIATLAIDLQTLREGLVRHAWTEPQLAEMGKYLANLDLLTEYARAMQGERALSVSGLDYVRRRGFRDNPMNYLGDAEGGSASVPNFNPMPSGWIYQNMKTISVIHQEFTLPAVDARAHRIFPEISEQGTRAVETMHTGPYTIFAKMLLPALQKALQKSARMQTYVDDARIACALERYRLAEGKLPESLDALAPRFINQIPTDVIDGKPLRWRRDGNGGYVLYSVGWNRTDDGGELAWVKQKKGSEVDSAKGDWAWLMPVNGGS
jgi:hypothetical protein